MIFEKKDRVYETNNDYLLVAITIVIASLVFFISIIYKYEIHTIFASKSFLTWHTTLELFGVVFSFIIFNNCYHSYKHTKRIRLLILSITFFTVACLDFLHAVSYEGMPYIFTFSSANLATTYWVIARLVMAIGIFTAIIIPASKKIDINEKLILLLSILLTYLFFFLVTYKPNALPPMYIEGKGLTILKIYLEYVVIFLQVMTVFHLLKNYKRTLNKYHVILSSGLIFMVFSEALFTLYKSVYDTFNLLGHLYKTLGLYLIYYSIFKYNVDMPYIKLKEAKGKISLYADNLEKIVDIRTKEFSEANNRLNRELDYARVIQQSLLPPSTMRIGNVVFNSEYIPCEKLSGDFYDIYEIDKENIGMYILDVTGHGVPAALLTMFSINNIKSNERLIKRYRGLKPHRNLKHFYEEFNKLNFPEEMHIVTFFATYNIPNKVLTYCSAGMNCYPILTRRTGEYELLDKSKGFPICQFGDFYTPEFKSAKIQLDEGDKIIFYTDGLIDLQKNSALSHEEFLNILLRNSNKDISTLNTDILEKLKNSNQNFDDDITYFIMEVS